MSGSFMATSVWQRHLAASFRGPLGCHSGLLVNVRVKRKASILPQLRLPGTSGATGHDINSQHSVDAQISRLKMPGVLQNHTAPEALARRRKGQNVIVSRDANFYFSMGYGINSISGVLCSVDWHTVSS
jgi:hypothetical protein